MTHCHCCTEVALLVAREHHTLSLTHHLPVPDIPVRWITNSTLFFPAVIHVEDRKHDMTMQETSIAFYLDFYIIQPLTPCPPLSLCMCRILKFTAVCPKILYSDYWCLGQVELRSQFFHQWLLVFCLASITHMQLYWSALLSSLAGCLHSSLLFCHSSIWPILGTFNTAVVTKVNSIPLLWYKHNIKRHLCFDTSYTRWNGIYWHNCLE